MWYWHDGADGWGVLWMGLMTAIVWLPLILVIVWGLRQLRPATRDHDAPSRQLTTALTARDEARAAYGRGEIERERFLQILEDLDRTERSS